MHCLLVHLFISNTLCQGEDFQLVGHFWILSVPFLTTSEEVDWLTWLVNLGRINWTCVNSLSLVFFSLPTETRSSSSLLCLQSYLVSLCTFGGLSVSHYHDIRGKSAELAGLVYRLICFTVILFHLVCINKNSDVCISHLF